MNEIKDFLGQNKEAFRILKQKIKSVDTVVGVKDEKELIGRARAIEIINAWLIELWNVSYPELPEPEEDDDIFKIIDNQ